VAPGRVDAGDGGVKLIEHRRSAQVFGVFAWYTRGLFGRKFSAVRFERSSLERLRSFAAGGGPMVMLGNHQSWWDPLVAVLVTGEVIPDRKMLAVMDASELERFGIFRRLGVFGLDPDDPASQGVMVSYLERLFARDSSQAFWITPQGRFTDVRSPIRLRPGAAAVAARLEGVRVGCVHMDYVFWNEPKPELLIRFEEAGVPDRLSTTGWLRTMTAAMERNRDACGALAMARDAEPFVTIAGRGGAGASGVYGAWLRIRGRGGELGAKRADAAGGGRLGGGVS